MEILNLIGIQILCLSRSLARSLALLEREKFQLRIKKSGSNVSFLPLFSLSAPCRSLRCRGEGNILCGMLHVRTRTEYCFCCSLVLYRFSARLHAVSLLVHSLRLHRDPLSLSFFFPITEHASFRVSIFSVFP
jgi:hypothetical protein